MSFPVFSPLSRFKDDPRGFVSSGAFLLFGTILGIVAADLLVSGQRQLAFGLVLLLPVTILIIKYPTFSVMVWLLLAPFLLTTPTAGGRTVYWMIHRALPPATVGMIVLSHLLRFRKLPRLGPAELAMIGYAGTTLFSIALLNKNPQATTYVFYDRVFSPMCLYFIVRLSSPGAKELKRLVPVIFFLGLSQAIIGTFSWFAPQFLPQQWLNQAGERTTGSLHSYSVYTSTLVFSGLYLLHTALNRKRGLVQTVFISVFFLSIFCVFISYSRGSWMAGIVILLGLAYLYRKFLLRWIFAIVLAATLFVGVIFVGDFPYVSERLSESDSALSRLPVALAAYRMFETKPISGWGYGNFDDYDRQFQGRVGDLVNANQDNVSHNVYLALLAEQGILGLTLFLAPVVWWLYMTMITKHKIPAEGFWSRRLLILLWLVILYHFIVNNFSHMRIVFGLGMWWFTLGLIANIIDQYSTVRAESVESISRMRQEQNSII